jgi:beta-phosphoglucomutase-like phosphatase (HAD superfamily)
VSGGRRALEHRLSAPRATKKTLGLPHAAAWAAALDELLGHRMEAVGERFAPFRPFDPRTDYYRHLRGRPRLDGIHAFLASRGIRLPEGRPNDPPGAETIHGLANRKDEALLERPHREGVHAFTGSLLYLEGLGEAGVPAAVVSPSANTTTILERSGLEPLAAAVVDGNAARAGRLRPKPAPDTLLAACRALGIRPERRARPLGPVQTVTGRTTRCARSTSRFE